MRYLAYSVMLILLFGDLTAALTHAADVGHGSDASCDESTALKRYWRVKPLPTISRGSTQRTVIYLPDTASVFRQFVVVAS